MNAEDRPATQGAPDAAAGTRASGRLAEMNPAWLRTMLLHLFQDLDEAVVVADADRRITLVNPAAARLFGYSTEELVGQPSRLLYDSSNAHAEQGRQRYNAGADASHEAYIVRYRRKDGATFDGETIGGPVEDPQGGQPIFLGIIRDVSSRLSSEGAIDRLHRITSDRALDFQARCKAILNLGCEQFGLQAALISRRDGDEYELIEAIDPEGGASAGERIPAGHTYCAIALAHDVPIGFHDISDSELADHECYRQFGFEAYLGVTIYVDGERYGALGFFGTAPTAPFTRRELDLAGMFAQWLGHEIARQADLQAMRAMQDKLSRLATIDDLTGLGNRRLATERLEAQLQRARRRNDSFAVALVDFDHFKRLNDSHGHAAGDAALRLFAEIARRSMRGSDFIGRWGGEEFIAVLEDDCPPSAIRGVERLVEAVRATPLRLDSGDLPLTVSAGVVISLPGESAEDIVARADAALYQAKSSGRDRVVLGPGPSESNTPEPTPG
ncbi:sensor domain-containing diguanylate cyclase [Salinisphaera aquimarina]|uniref:Diguanylate cyclase n=1 Tax=Salinisphaera aquimarina TaxID=2094031 RepID=A0ABV7EMR6_9GAMM